MTKWNDEIVELPVNCSKRRTGGCAPIIEVCHGAHLPWEKFTPGWWKACSSQPVEPWILEQCGLHPGYGPDFYLWKGPGSFTIRSVCVLSTYRKLRMRSPGCPCWLYWVCDWTSRFSSELEARERLPLARSRLEVAWMGDWMDGPQHCGMLTSQELPVDVVKA